MAAPAIAIVVILTVWSIVPFALASVETASLVRALNVILGFIGIISIVALPVCFVVGLIVALKPKK